LLTKALAKRPGRRGVNRRRRSCRAGVAGRPALQLSWRSCAAWASGRKFTKFTGLRVRAHGRAVRVGVARHEQMGCRGSCIGLPYRNTAAV